MASPDAPAGYSGTPLDRKLGIKPGNRVLQAAAPRGFRLSPPGAVVQTRAGRRPYDLVLAFVRDRCDLSRRSSGVPTDLDENVLREVVLRVDQTWSGLRFVVRLGNR